MLMALDHLCFIVLSTKPIAVALLTCIGVGSFLWPISSNAMRIGTVFLAARKVAPTSASMAKLITVLIFFARPWSTPFGVSVFVGVVPGRS